MIVAGQLLSVTIRKPAGLIQTFLATHGSKAADVGQGQRKAEFIFVSNIPERKAAIFHANSAAVPVVAHLGGGILQEPELVIEADATGGSETGLVGVAVAE